MEYYENKLVRRGSVERRDYQVSLARQAASENCIVVLPTGLGKTAVALQVICEYMQKGGGGALLLAPTRVLANQHHKFLAENVLLDDIVLITGEDPIGRRRKLWPSSIVCATPEIARNDMERGISDPAQFALVVFDEAHRAVGDYAYCGIARRLPPSARMMGMTATLPSEREKATEILVALRAASVAQRTEESEDVRPYVRDTATQWIRVQLPGELKAIQALLKLALEERYSELKGNGVGVPGQMSLSGLLKLRPFVLAKKKAAARPLFTAIRVHYALNILEAHGVTPFLKFCERARKKGGAGARHLFEEDPNFTRALQLARSARERGVEHPKIPRLRGLLEGLRGKALVFSSYRDSVDTIHRHLAESGIRAGILIGKSGESGLKQRKQIEAVQKFRDGEYSVLIATRVGEEGLDISEVNLVVFYDNVPSSIRFVQRRGRTGRHDAGRLAVLIAEDTIDEAYYWIGRRKIESARSMGSRMTRALEGGRVQTALGDFA